jgi:2-polyprenyl-3-methyl-5-hydroxy-6-metoxy-1,4-benzoquinol methylase
VYLKEALPEATAREFYSGDDWRAIVYAQDVDDTFLEHLFQDQVRRARLALEFIERVTGNLDRKRCLDIGSGTGGFVYALRGIGAIAEGVEPSISHSGYAVEHYHLDIRPDHFEQLSTDGSYDLILCVRALNHFLDAAQVLSRMRMLLAPGGFLYLEVLNFPHALRRKSLKQCVKLDHPYMFSVRTLSAMLERSGFETVALDCDLNRTHDFGSLNHIHVLARVTAPARFIPAPLAAIEAKLECLLSLGQYISEQVGRLPGEDLRIEDRS